MSAAAAGAAAAAYTAASAKRDEATTTVATTQPIGGVMLDNPTAFCVYIVVLFMFVVVFSYIGTVVGSLPPLWKSKKET